MKRISREQRRARLAMRHRLASPAHDSFQVADSLVAVHSSDPASVFLAMWARVDGFEPGHLESQLYEDKRLVRHWAMRRTLWVVPRDRLPIIVASSTDSIGEKERKRTIRFIEEGGVAGDGALWLEMALPKTLETIHGHGEVLARRLSAEIPELAKKIVFTNKAGRVVGSSGMSSRVLVQLGLESRVVRGRPAGTWVSGQYTWAVMEDWLDGPLERPSPREASASLMAAWLGAFGPGTETDLRWWTGWTQRQVRTALADVGAIDVDLMEDGMGFVLPDDLDDDGSPGSWVALLPPLDSTTMGWKERQWYLGEHASAVFDSNGNAGPTVWVDGRIVGGWAQRSDGEIVYEVFEDPGTDAIAEIEARCARLRAWLGEVRVTPRFRSPHDLKLTT